VRPGRGIAILLATVMLAGVACFGPAVMEWPSRFEERKFASEHVIKRMVNTDYLLYLPPEYESSDKDWPLLLFLHGGLNGGENLARLMANGPPRIIAVEGKDLPFVVVAPQCPRDDTWFNKQRADAVDALLEHMISTYRIDPDRVYGTGLSWGGSGIWRMAIEHPDRFAAIAPMACAGQPSSAARIKHIPAWVFHGEKDERVLVSHARDMVEALKRVGGNVKLTVYPQGEHNAWTVPYHSQELYDWLLEHTRPRK